MPIGVQNFIGRRLTEARLARGLFMKSLGDLVGLTGVAIARYEDGKDKPREDKLAALASQLGFPRDFFLRPVWPENIELVYWRSRVSETKSAREMTEQRMRWLCEIFAFLETDLNFPSVDIPNIDLPVDFRMILPDAIESAAMAVRDHWGLRDFPVPDMLLALENAGIPVTCLEVTSDKQDGFCFWSERLRRPFVGINVYEVSCARARYDAAHELGHLVMHRHITPQQARDPVLHKIMEQQAHRFAGAFLFPRQPFLSQVGAATLDYFSSLKKTWGMSIAAMVYRAHDLGLVSDEEKSLLFQNMTRRRWRGALREPFDGHEEMPLERPRMLKRGLEAIVGEGFFGQSAIQSALALPSNELEEITGVPRGTFGKAAELVELAVPKRTLRTTDVESGKVLEFPLRKANR